MKDAGLNEFGDEFELHDGIGEDGVVTSLMIAAVECVDYFNLKYLTEDGYWYGGVLDYEAWDSFEGSVSEEFYRVIVAIACERAETLYRDDVVDAYAMRMGWLPGRGGQPLNDDNS